MSSSIPLYDALLSANVAPDKAKAVAEAFERERETMVSQLVTKDDLRTSMELLESRLTVKLGAMLFAAVGLAVALIKVL
jgi:2-phosphoglycerate kinase